MTSWKPSALTQVNQWPVDTVAAAVHADDGSQHTHGDNGRVSELASATKLLAAVGMLVAVEEGTMGLGQELTPPGHKATVRHLLAYSGGVGSARHNLEKEPGERRVYPSAGFDIVADVVAAEAEMPPSEYLRQAIFEPLGVDDSALDGSAEHDARSSVANLMAFVDEIFTPTLLHPDIITEALAVQSLGLNGVVPGYGIQHPVDQGLGFEIFGYPDSEQGLWFDASTPKDVTGHFGQAGTFLWLHRPIGRTAIALTDRVFGEWAKPLWTDFNDELWRELEEHAEDQGDMS